MTIKVKTYLLLGCIASITLAISCRVGIEKAQVSARQNWSAAGGDEGQTKYSTLTQINKKNVKHLKEAWRFNTGDSKGNIQLNPLVIDGVIYVTNPTQELIALDGSNGKQLWKFDPSRDGQTGGGVNRGLAYWKNGKEGCVLYTVGPYVYAVNANTGRAYEMFGDKGRIDLRQGHTRAAEEIGLSAPAAPVIYNDYVIVGVTSWSTPAFMAAYHIPTGKRVWKFNTIPEPGEFGYDTWGDPNFWKNGAGVNVWGGLSVDSKNGLVFFATGQPKDDFYRPGNEGAQLYGNSVVALNAATGERKWHYQYIHHDLWDLDLPCAPIVTELMHEGKRIPGLVQLTKTGNTLLFNRITGELLSKVEERAVPASPLAGEHAYPTQPYITWPEPFAKQVVTEADLSRRTPEVYEKALATFRSADTGWFVPPSEKGIIYYGIHGGAEWGGGSYDPRTNRLYVNSNELAWHITMRDIKKDAIKEHPGREWFLIRGCVSCHGSHRNGMGGAPDISNLGAKYSRQEVINIIKRGRGGMPSFGQMPEAELQQLVSYLLEVSNDEEVEKAIQDAAENPVYRALAYTKFLDDQGYPATAPPWGTMNAIDLTSGKIIWKVPLGEHAELTKQYNGITGTENFGGSIVTAGGIVFIAATRDEKIRAFDADTGEVLWEAKLPYGGYAIPSTYSVNGKQYLVIAAAGGGKLGTTTGDTYIAFSLPN